MVEGAATITLDASCPQLLNEVGGHRIQRVPRNDRRGRIHTSTVTVSVLDGVDDGVAALRDEDLTYRWFSGTGKGGQHRNKHQNSVEITHIPTGLSRSAQTRSRETSLRDARGELERAVLASAAATRHDAINRIRSNQVGLGMRADKRRTWRMRDDQVTDDLTGRTTSFARAMKGYIDDLWPRS